MSCLRPSAGFWLPVHAPECARDVVMLPAPVLTHLHSPAAPRAPLAEFVKNCKVKDMDAQQRKAYARARKEKQMQKMKATARAEMEAQMQEQMQAHAGEMAQMQAQLQAHVRALARLTMHHATMTGIHVCFIRLNGVVVYRRRRLVHIVPGELPLNY